MQACGGDERGPLAASLVACPCRWGWRPSSASTCCTGALHPNTLPVTRAVPPTPALQCSLPPARLPSLPPVPRTTPARRHLSDTQAFQLRLKSHPELAPNSDDDDSVVYSWADVKALLACVTRDCMYTTLYPPSHDHHHPPRIILSLCDHTPTRYVHGLVCGSATRVRGACASCPRSRCLATPRSPSAAAIRTTWYALLALLALLAPSLLAPPPSRLHVISFSLNILLAPWGR